MQSARQDFHDLSPSECAQLDEDGFLVRRNLFSAEECSRLAAACERALSIVLAEARRVKVKGEAYAFEFRSRLRTLVKWEPKDPGLLQGIEPCAHLDPLIRSVGADERLLAPSRIIAGAQAIAPFTEKLNVKRARRGGGFALHQDYPYWAPMTMAADRIATAMFCLDDCTRQSGCLEVAPGSHRQGAQACKTNAGEAALEMDPRAFDIARLVPVEAPAGSVIFFGAFLAHRSGPNASEHDRRALLYSYQPAGNRHIREILRG